MRTDDLTIPQGVTWGYAWPIVDQDAEPVDLTGWTVQAQIRASTESTAVLHEWSTQDGSATVTGGMVTLLLTPAQSTPWQWFTGVYDVELTDTDGNVYRVSQGRAVVSREVTR